MLFPPYSRLDLCSLVSWRQAAQSGRLTTGDLASVTCGHVFIVLT